LTTSVKSSHRYIAAACAWIAGCSLVAPSLGLAQDRTDRDVVDLIVRDGPQAMAIRAETEVVRREQLARLASRAEWQRLF